MRAIQWGKNVSERARDLAAKIAVETDPEKYAALVGELNRLLDGEQPSPNPTPEA